jgi:hypothetical protein
VACNSNNVNIENLMQGKLIPTKELEATNSKKFNLDSVSAPKPRYVQIFIDITGKRYFSFLNDYTNSIYIYDYSVGQFVSKIVFDKKGLNGIPIPTGYYIVNLDTIYVYDKFKIEIVLANQKGQVTDRITLNDKWKNPIWYLYYPQYDPQTVCPLLLWKNEIILTGQYFKSVPDSLLSKWKFSAHINIENQGVEFHHLYPDMYGSESNWEGGIYTEVFPELHPGDNKMIYSFPISHDIYLTAINSSSYKKVYAGSNFAKNISSINKKVGRPNRGELLIHHCKQDFYTAIIYDKFREVYYRFLWKGIDNATIHSRLEDKPISVIILDRDFKYLGETIIGNGKDWNWRNSFVTKEGLNIEYIEKDFKEVYLTFKIFTIKNIKDESR